MKKNEINLNDKIFSNNNNKLVEIMDDLNELMNSVNDNKIIKRLSDIIEKINLIINENKKNVELIKNDISSLYDKLNKKFDESKINNVNKKEFIIIIMILGKVIYIKVNLLMINLMEKEFIILKMVIVMKVIGKMEKKKEKEFFIIMMEIDMKEISKIMIEMEKVFFIIVMVIGKWEII